MRKLFFILLIAAPTMSLAFDDHDIESEVEAEGFVVGNDSDLGGQFFYIVDRTNNLCFAGFHSVQTPGGSGLTSIDCDKLKTTNKINKFMSGKKLD